MWKGWSSVCLSRFISAVSPGCRFNRDVCAATQDRAFYAFIWVRDLTSLFYYINSWCEDEVFYLCVGVFKSGLVRFLGPGWLIKNVCLGLLLHLFDRLIKNVCLGLLLHLFDKWNFSTRSGSKLRPFLISCNCVSRYKRDFITPSDQTLSLVPSTFVPWK
jgi:hypothetical protein